MKLGNETTTEQTGTAASTASPIRTSTVIPEKAPGFEAFLAITIFLDMHTGGRKK